MNKQEFQVASTSYSQIYMSSVLQYDDTTNNRKYLLFASREKNHLYVTRASLSIVSLSLTIGNVEMNDILAYQEQIFLDISELLRAFVGTTQTLTLRIKNKSFTETHTFYVVVSEGLRYDRLAENAQIADVIMCENIELSTYQYDNKRTLSFALPPTTIYAPLYNDGTSPHFRNISQIVLPIYRSALTPAGMTIRTTDVVGNVPNQWSAMQIDVNALRNYGISPAEFWGTTRRLSNVIFRPFEDGKSYICVKWKSPYIPNLYFSATSGGPISWANYYRPLSGITFFELVKNETDSDITEFENTGAYMPYKVEFGRTITIAMRDITAYDYVYYSQIFLSEEIEIQTARYFSSGNHFQPARLKKKKYTMPQSGTMSYNLEIELIIDENV
jgi:hypothetical protein